MSTRVLAAGYRRLHRRVPVGPVPGPGAAPWPSDGATGAHRTVVADDSSRLPDAPGSYEWWNFFAQDTRPGHDLAVSAIFMPANLFDTRYRRRVHDHRCHRSVDAPTPGRHPLLQINVAHRGRKVFTTVRHPPGATVEWSRAEPFGRVGSSTFAAGVEDGETVYRLHLDHPGMTNLTRLQGELTFRSPDGGFAVGGGGLYGAVPGGAAHRWQFPLALPQVTGRLRVVNRRGRATFDQGLEGVGYTDHCWGEGLLGDVLDRWYFGRVDLAGDGAVVAVWLVPHHSPPYGRLLRIRPGRSPVVHEVLELLTARPRTGAMGLDFAGEVTLVVATGAVRLVFPRRLGEDWPFQVSGDGRIDVELADDVSVRDRAGPVEHLSHPRIDDPFFALLDSMVPRIPWFR